MTASAMRMSLMMPACGAALVGKAIRGGPSTKLHASVAALTQAQPV